MDSTSMKIGPTTPAKEKTTQSKPTESLRNSENANPNFSSPGLKSINQSGNKAKNPKPSLVDLTSPSPKKKIRERKYVIVKKKTRNDELMPSSTTSVACEKCNMAIGRYKCLCVAYENLRASQEEFFRNRGEIEDEVSNKLKEIDTVAEKIEIDKAIEKKTDGTSGASEANGENKDDRNVVVVNSDMALKRSRERLLEEARKAVSSPGSWKVMDLVKEFEKLSMLKPGDSEEKVEEMKKELPGLQKPIEVPEFHVSSSSFCPSDFILTSENLGLDRSYSLDSSHGSISTLTSVGGPRPGRTSTESFRNHNRRQCKKKPPKVTSQKPFMLRTEERGRYKEEEFMKKLLKMMEEEEKMRIPIAQGLPWTTDEPECLVKPPVKESTRPIDIALHSGERAVERSKFDQQVAMKMNLIEQYRMEMERQQKLAEEEEVRRLRKELVPKAQPMPYFDRPFIPHRSMKQLTIPKEPKFHIPEHKKIKCYLSMDDFYVRH